MWFVNHGSSRASLTNRSFLDTFEWHFDGHNPRFIPLRETLKQFFARSGLSVIRLLVRIKPHALAFFRTLVSPFSKVGRIFVNAFFVPLYHVFYLVRKEIGKAWRPAKNRFMVFVTNRYAVHVTVAAIAAIAIILNIKTTDVRAETFGEKSLMYAIASNQGIEIIEEYAEGDAAVNVVSINYRPPTALSSYARGIDFISSDQVPVTMLGGGALASPTISEHAESTAPRTEVETYTVQSGDTLSTIAAQFGISLNTLLWANNLTVRSVLKPGAQLVILPTSGVQHTVASGDTLTKIATRYKAEEDEILKFNRLASADDLVVGEKLIVPGGEIPAPIPTRPSVSTVFSQPSSTIPTTTSGAAPTTPGSGVMVWPTDLHVITQYFGWGHTGIDVDCGFTNDNYAADDGIVQFAGWKGGYGYAVEINHGNGLVTRYGHHASLYVSAGQQISKGTAIGRCGTTGRSTGTHLHFEVMSGGKFKNPLEYVR